MAYFERGNPKIHLIQEWIGDVGLANVLYAVGIACDENGRRGLDQYTQEEWRIARNSIDRFVRTLREPPISARRKQTSISARRKQTA